MNILIGILYALVAAILAISTLVGLPGIWLMIALAGLVDLIQVLLQYPTSFSWVAFAIAGGIGIAAEAVELLAGAAGAKAGGAKRAGIFGALIGGILGAIIGTFTIPIPLIGTFIGAALGAGMGAFIGEVSRDGATVKGSIKPAGGAAAGRVAGTIAKAGFAFVIWVVLVVDAFL